MAEPSEEHARLLVDLVNPRLVRLKRAAVVAAGILVLQGMAFAAGAVYYRASSGHTESMLMDAGDAREIGLKDPDVQLCGTFTEGTKILSVIAQSMPPISVCTSRHSDTCAGGAETVTALAYEENRFQVGQAVDALRTHYASSYKRYKWARGTVVRAFSNHSYMVQWSNGVKPESRRASQMRLANTSDKSELSLYANAVTFQQGFQRALSLWAPLLLGPHESLRSNHADLKTLEGIYRQMLIYSKEARWPAADEKSIFLTRRGLISNGFCVSYDDWGRTVAKVFDSRKEAVAFADGISKDFAHIVVDLSSDKHVHKYGSMDFSVLTDACHLSNQVWSLDFCSDALQWLEQLRNRTQKFGRTWPCQFRSRQCGSYQCFGVTEIGCVPRHHCSDSVVSVHKAIRTSWVLCFLNSAQLISNYELIATGIIMVFYMFFTKGLSWCNSADLKGVVKIASEGSTQAEVEAMHRGE